MKKEWLVKILVMGTVVVFIGAGVVSALKVNSINESKPLNRGNWLYVGGYGQGNYTRIQDAIDNASTSDAIYVYDDASPYLEQLTINTSLSLIGENQTTTIINSKAEEYYTIVTINADNVNLNNFTIILNGGPGIEVLANHTSLSNLTLCSGIHGWSGTGINLYNAYDTVIIDSIIKNAQIAILLTNATYTTIVYNLIVDPGLNGIILFSSDNLIDNNVIIGNLDPYTQPVGIYCSGSRNTISHNIINAMVGNATDGISLSGGIDNVIEGNALNNTGFTQYKSEANLFINNSVNDKPLVFLVHQSDNIIDTAGQVILINCTRMIVQDLTLSNARYGIQLSGTTNSIIRHCNIFSCLYGVYLETSQENLIQNNTISNCEYGLNINKGGSNSIENNTITGSCYNGLLINSQNTQVSHNLIDSSNVGIMVSHCLHSIVIQNTIRHCLWGIYLELAADTTIKQNTILNTKLCAGFYNSILNHWTDNYWGRPKILLKIIPGIILIYKHPDPFHYKTIIIPWINVDRHPALKPYDIPVEE